jgi:hypothetical protein
MKRISLLSVLGVVWLFGGLALSARGDENSSGGPLVDPADRVQALPPTGESNPGTIVPRSVLAADAASPATPEPPPVPPTPPSSAAQPEPAAAGTEGAPCPEHKPWHLPQPLESCLGIHFSGWLEQGLTFNDDHPQNHFNGPVAANDQDRYLMDQLWLVAERPAENNGCGWALGGRVDLLFGSDWRFGINNGLETGIDGFHDQPYGMVIPQFYVEVAYDDLKVKIGHYAGILDYEVVAAPANLFYSHSYTYPYSSPILVTGCLADYKLSDCLSVQCGVDQGWYRFFDGSEAWDIMAGFRYQSCDKKTTLSYSFTVGPQDFNGVDDRFVYSLVLQQTLSEKWQYIMVQDLGVEGHTGLGGTQADWYSLCQYLHYTINPKLSANMRVEFFRDEDGTRVAGPGNIPGVAAWTGRGFAGTFNELTFGLNWHPCPNIIVRPEIRYDWYRGARGFDNLHPNGGALPFDDGNHSSQLLVASDLIWLF